ncbi:choice-of-anchor P family protein [Spirillospora sp. NBC_00431]
MRLQTITKCAAVVGALALPFAAVVPTASATSGGAGSAVAISATGPVAIPPTPAVTSNARQPERKNVAELPPNALGIEASLLNAAAWSGHGRASVTDLRIAKLGFSASTVTAKCENGNGVSHLKEATFNGRKLKLTAAPNSSMTANVPGLGSATLTLNKHVRDKDGNLSITAIELTATLAGKTQTIAISSVTCGKAGKPGDPSVPPSKPSEPGAPSAPSTPPGVAPAPTPVTGDLPVTG